MSSSHIDSNLILSNSLLGLSEDVVAYYPFKYSPNEAITGAPPITNTNTTITENGIAIEEGTTNLYGNISNLYAIDANSTLIEEEYKDSYYNGSSIVKITKLAGNPSTHASFRRCVPCLENTVYTLSWKLKIISGGIDSIGTHFLGGTSGPNTHFHDIGDGWYQFYYTGTTSATTILCVGIGFIGDQAGEFLITEPQLEQKSFYTSYTETSRNIGKFTYSSNNFWTDDFSLFMRCKIRSTEGWRMVGGAWNLWYFSWYSNSVDMLRLSWVDETQKTLQTPHIENLDCREWNIIGFTYEKSSTTAKIYVNGKLEQYDNTVNFNGSDITETSIGDISYNSHSYKLNGSIKDYIVFNRALTDEEILQLSINPISYSKEEVIL